MKPVSFLRKFARWHQRLSLTVIRLHTKINKPVFTLKMAYTYNVCDFSIDNPPLTFFYLISFQFLVPFVFLHRSLHIIFSACTSVFYYISGQARFTQTKIELQYGWWIGEFITSNYLFYRSRRHMCTCRPAMLHCSHKNLNMNTYDLS